MKQKFFHGCTIQYVTWDQFVSRDWGEVLGLLWLAWLNRGIL